MQLLFGIGALWGNRTDVQGSGIGPDQFGILQDNTIEVDFDTKELYGQLQFPVDIARGKGKIMGKAKLARVAGTLYGDLFFGITAVAGSQAISEDEVQTVPAVGPYTITVTNAVNYLDDLGIFYGSGTLAGNRFLRVASAPTIGQYSVNLASGVYTFAAGDANAQVKISYRWNNASVGKKITITNQFMGATPVFLCTFYHQRNTQGSAGYLTMVLNQCTSSKLGIPSKLDDYAIPEFDFQAFADATNTIGTISTTD